jgi:hypothetical protein
MSALFASLFYVPPRSVQIDNVQSVRQMARLKIITDLHVSCANWHGFDMRHSMHCNKTSALNVAFGSKADIEARPVNVRFTPESGHWLSGS